VLVALDLWSKAAVFAWLEPLKRQSALVYDVHGHPRWPLAGEWLTFMLSLNPGAAFGQLESFPRSPAGRKVFNLALVLVLGGALGNLYDNLFLDLPHDGRPFGPVRDFIDVYFGVWDWHFPTFNVADSCISVGAVLLLVSSFGAERRRARASVAPPQALP
jgi:lipoprotein signal peptidase